jgi:hypothetical protein
VSRALAIMGLGVTAFAVTLAVYVGSRLSNEAMSVLTGAACGVSAMLPAAIMGALALLRRRERQDAAPPSPWMQPGAPQQYPPIIVVAPPAASNALAGGDWQRMYPQAFSAPVGGRQFSVIGEEEGVWNNEHHGSWQ